MNKQLIVPVVTPGGLAKRLQLDQIPDSFTQSCRKLMNHISQYANGILVAGTTGEGHLLSLDQYRAVLHTFSKLSDRPLYAGLLWHDEVLTSQLAIARDTRYSQFVLALNHTGNIIKRLRTVLDALKPSENIFLYNMPGWFTPARIELLDDIFYSYSCVKWIKDSSGDAENFPKLLALKKDHPHIQVFHGSEAGYEQLTDDERENTDGLVSGTANVDTELMYRFLNYCSPTCKRERSKQANAILDMSPEYISSNIWVTIQNYISGIKKSLAFMGIFDMESDIEMYSESGEFFPEQK